MPAPRGRATAKRRARDRVCVRAGAGAMSEKPVAETVRRPAPAAPKSARPNQTGLRKARLAPASGGTRSIASHDALAERLWVLLKPLPALGKSRGEVIVTTAVVGVLNGRQFRGRCCWPLRAFGSGVATGVTVWISTAVRLSVLLLLCGLAGGFLRRLGFHGLLRSFLCSFLFHSHIASKLLVSW